MLSVDLWHLFAPLLVGSFAFFGLAFLYWLFFTADSESYEGDCASAQRRPGFLTWFNKQLTDAAKRSGDASGLREFLLYPLAACALFGLGVVVDAAVDDFVDGKPTAAAPIRWIAAMGLPRESELRFGTMFDIEPIPETVPWWKRLRELAPLNFSTVAYSCDDRWRNVARGREVIVPSGLGAELLDSREGYAHFLDLSDAVGVGKVAQRRALARQILWCPQTLLATDKSGIDESSCPQALEGKLELVATRDAWERHCALAKHLTRKIYYDATNYIREQSDVNAELNRWHAQKGLLGATHVVSSIVVVMLIGWLVTVGWASRRRNSACRWLAVLLIASWFSAYGFTLSTRNYIERTLGIYSSALHYDKDLIVRSGQRALRAECARVRGQIDSHLWNVVCHDVFVKEGG